MQDLKVTLDRLLGDQRLGVNKNAVEDEADAPQETQQSGIHVVPR